MAQNTYTITATYSHDYTSGKGSSGWRSNFQGYINGTRTTPWICRNGADDYNHYGVYAFEGADMNQLLTKVASGATVVSISLSVYSNSTISPQYAGIGLNTPQDRNYCEVSSAVTFGSLGMAANASGWIALNIGSLSLDLNSYVKGITLGIMNASHQSKIYTFGNGSTMAYLTITLDETYTTGYITVSKSSLTCYFQYADKYVTGSNGFIIGSGDTEAAATNSAISNARSLGFPTSYTGGGTTDSKYIGYRKPVYLDNPTTTQKPSDIWVCTARGADNYIYKYQIYVPLTVPSTITASNLVTATISYTASSSDAFNHETKVCAPATSSSTISGYATLDNGQLATAKGSIPGNTTNGALYTANITAQLRQALVTGQHWLLLTIPDESIIDHDYMAIVSDITIFCLMDDKKIFININGGWEKATPYINVNGTWKEVIPWIKLNGTWKKIE